ncbi:hypothetical protein BABINDRAFT_159116 [Babjeviella inositovora NRRL Y-12698]|uniref:Major facilitator superfamily (MFS) profile domain-containing protein n=1 Tax=Babjeviella inositovora NRRL Y-12698 TaxID=984486 RepID=A0A1E3QZP3_9ASCO|nr:uncharacterized protein BABINDRAFT_159116 [Babjeviella inositovora NRRL Y-12698]ODQ82552.1 hypothetical protein BABINDRAFT_159116 [Babjeviella inositovora NRRL Y-12698]
MVDPTYDTKTEIAPTQSHISLHDSLDANSLKSDGGNFAGNNENPLSIPASLQHLSDEEIEVLEKRVRRRIDLRILPMLVLIYILNYLDRNNIATARLAGLEEDLNMTSVQYQTTVSILFVGYILMQIPANMFLTKVGRPRIFIPCIMISWGVISTCVGAVQSYGGLIAIRFLLGWVEAGFFGCSLYFLSCWYTRKELALRTSILYSGSLISGAFAGLIGAGIINGMDGARGLSAWRWLFIIEGAITVFVVPFAFLILPDMPSNTKFLSQQEKDIVMWKLCREVGTNDWVSAEEQSFKTGFMLAVKDVKVWMITGILSFLVAACGVTNFFPSVVATLKFGRIETLCLTAPPYLICVIATFVWAIHADRTGERFWHVVAPLCMALASFIISAATMNTAARYFAMCIMVPSLYCAFTVILSWMSNCVARPPMKRAVSLALMNCLSNSTSIWNAYLYPASDAPQYLVAFCCNCGFIIAAIVLCVILKIHLQRLNKKIETGIMDWEPEMGKGVDNVEINRTFRFLT